MGGSPFLGLQRTGSPILVLYNNPPSSITLGSSFGVADTGTLASDQPVNLAIYFTGSNIYAPSGGAGSYYAAVGNSIYRTLNGGNSWSVATTIPLMNLSTHYKSGLNIVTVDGVQHMCLMYVDNVGRFRGISTVDGYAWNSNGPSDVILLVAVGGLTQDTVLGSTLYSILTVSNYLLSYQPGNAGIVSLTLGPIDMSQSAMCVWDNSIYIAGYSGTSRPLYRLSGGWLAQVANLDTSGSNASTTNKLGMFVDGPNLYVFSLQVAASTGWACYQIDTPGTYNVTKLTSVISGSMAVQGASGPGPDSRVLTYVDGNSSPGANPTKYILYSPNGTSPAQFEQFKWNGPNAPMTSIAAGGDVTHALTVSKRSASNGMYSPYGVYPYIISSSPSTSGTVGWRVNFTLWGQLSNPLVSIRLWYGGYDDEYQTQVGTLADPAVSAVPGTPGPVAPNGTLGPNNTSITGLTVDAGLTLYSFTWIPPASITDVANSRFNFLIETF